MNTHGLALDAAALEQLLQIDRNGWYEEMEAIGDYLAGYGDAAPAALEAEQRKIVASLA